MDRITCIVLVGAPCSGKSTIGKAFAKEHGWRYISSGDIARYLATGSKTIKDNLDKGKLAPELQMRNAIVDRMARCITDHRNVIADGFPRFGDQAAWFNHSFRDMVDIHYVLIDASLDSIIERSNARNRSDDKSLDNRLEYYYGTTLNELQVYIDSKIDTDELSTEHCLERLESFVKEVYKNGTKDC